MAMKKENQLQVVEVKKVCDYNIRNSNALGFALFGNRWKPSSPTPPKLACVYAFEMSNDTVKIGVTQNVDQRKKGVNNFLTVKRIHYTEFAPSSFMRKIESNCHRIFAERRVHGEYFDITFEEAVDELDRHADEIANALAESDKHYLAELDYFFNEYLPVYEKTQITNEILPSIRRTGSYSLVGKENELLAPFADFVALEREKFIAANTEEAKTMAKVQLLRELASASKDDFIRNELVRHAAKLLIGEDFGVKDFD